MPQGHKPQWNGQQLKLAVKSVLIDGKSKKAAAKQHNIPRSTLQRRLKEMSQNGGVVEDTQIGRPCTLTAEQEEELVSIIMDMESRLYGLTPENVRSVVFSFCKKYKVENRFNADKGMAGRKWLKLFLRRHPELSVRQPEKTSIQRAIGFNKAKVDKFYEILGKMLLNDDGSPRILPSQIYNVDESGFTINQNVRKIVAKKGKKNVGVLTSCEKGKTVTAVCCVSASGEYVPPAFIFPRVRYKPELLDKGPVGSIGLATKSGWINDTAFSAWFDHFVKSVQPKHRQSPTLLIMDGHTSHTNNIEVLQKAKENNVEILVLPSHCTHKLQPLDIAVFKSLNTFYDKEVDYWLKAHPGRAVAEANIAEIFTAAWGKSANIRNATSGFQKSGIHPYRNDLFTEDDFVGAEMTDKPEPDMTSETPALSGDSLITPQAVLAAQEQSDVPTTSELDGRCLLCMIWLAFLL